MPSKRRSGKERVSKQAAGPWLIHFFRRHSHDEPSESVPAHDFFESCPTKVSAMMIAVTRAVAEAPPPTFSGGGKWEAMHGKMGGIYEIRVDGPDRHHYRLFCLLERAGAELGLGGPSLVLVTGMDKPFQTKLSDRDYDEVLKLVREFRKRTPRSVLR